MFKHVIIKESFQSHLELGEAFPLVVDISEPDSIIDYSKDPHQFLNGVDISAKAIAKALDVPIQQLIDDELIEDSMLSEQNGQMYLYFYDFEVKING